MKNQSGRILIDYYSDVLCVWAWIAQPRLEEMSRQWGDQISIRHRYVDIFGDCQQKILNKWGQKDGFDKFSKHISKSVEKFEGIDVNDNIWSVTRPQSSMQAHLFLKGVGIVAGDVAIESMALRFRKAFFDEAQDISDLALLLSLATEQDLDTDLISAALNNGTAIAALSCDLRAASDLGVKDSPTWVLNEGRQILYGNVGYRILSANIEELLKNNEVEASWC